MNSAQVDINGSRKTGILPAFQEKKAKTSVKHSVPTRAKGNDKAKETEGTEGRSTAWLESQRKGESWHKTTV